MCLYERPYRRQDIVNRDTATKQFHSFSYTAQVCQLRIVLSVQQHVIKVEATVNEVCQNPS